MVDLTKFEFNSVLLYKLNIIILFYNLQMFIIYRSINIFYLNNDISKLIFNKLNVKIVNHTYLYYKLKYFCLLVSFKLLLN